MSKPIRPQFNTRPGSASLSARGARPPSAPPVYRPQPVPKVLQRKSPVAPQARPSSRPPAPTAPPVYRPQPVPRVLQTKTAQQQTGSARGGAQSGRPTPPPVYRPQPAPKCLQPRMASTTPPPVNGQPGRKTPAAPPVYRPQPTPKVLQTKTPLAPRPHAGHTPTVPRNHPRPQQQPARPPVIQPYFTFQGKEMNKDEVGKVHNYLKDNGHLDELGVDVEFQALRDSKQPESMAAWLVNRRIYPKGGVVGILNSSKVESSDDESSDDDSSDDLKTPIKKSTSNLDVTHFANSPSPSSPEPYVTGKQKVKGWDDDKEEEFLAAWAAHLQKKYDSQPKAKEKRKQEIAQSSHDERDLNRLAWVLEKLKGARTCVAALITEKSLYVYANKIDKDLAGDLEELKKVVTDTKAYEELLERVKSGTAKELRTNKTDENIKKKHDKAERRLKKAIELVQGLDSRESGVKFKVHEPKTDDKHAEMRAADTAKAKATGSVGISKLCCGKCALALDALQDVHEINFKVLGVHLKTYETNQGWPIPNFLLKSEDAMRKFLGESAFAIWKDYKIECNQLIKEKKLEVKGFGVTDMVSSDEESDSD